MGNTKSATASGTGRTVKGRNRLKVAAWGLSMTMVVFTLAPAAWPAEKDEMKKTQKAMPADASVTRSPEDTRPTLTLRVYNYAHLDPALLASAEKVTASILGNAGAASVWVECPLSLAGSDRFPGCQQEMRTTDFVIRLLSASMAVKMPASNEPLGFAQHCPDAEPGCVANIFYAKIDELASLGSARILGHVMAHELGHLLLGDNAHSHSGVMRGEWSREDLKFMSWTELTFTPRQSDQIRDTLLRRLRLTRSMADPTIEVIYQNVANLSPDMLSGILSLAAAPFKRAGVDVKFTDSSTVGTRSISEGTPQLVFTHTPLTSKSKKRDVGGESVENRAYVYPNEITTPQGLAWVTAHEIGHSLGLQHRRGRNVMSQDIDLHDDENKLMPGFTPEDAETLKSKATPVTLSSDFETPSQTGSISR